MTAYQPIPQRAYYKFLSPSIIVLLLLTVLPVLFTLYLSTSSPLLRQPKTGTLHRLAELQPAAG